MKNTEITEIFHRIATMLEIKEDNIFKIKAYRKAAENIEALGEDVADIRRENRLADIPGIGEALREKIIEYLDTGTMTAYEHLKKEIPEGLLEICEIPSVGPKKTKLFYEQLKIKTVAQLKEAAQKGRLLGLPGIQEKTIENILRGIKIIRAGQERMDLGTAYGMAQNFIEALKKLPEVKNISVAGSLRRMKETIRDIDILIISSNPKKVMDVFVKLPQVKGINAHGETKSSLVTENNVQVDLRVVEPKSFGAALLYFTGSKNFNVKLRQIAIQKNMKVNEYGVFEVKGSKEKFLGGETEEEVFEALDLEYVPPELREDIGEAELFALLDAGQKVPPLVELSDIKGDLQMHSTWSDGKNTIEELARAAEAMGYEYIAVTDHSPRLRIAGGVSAQDLVKKKKEIDNLNGRFKDFRILYGSEVEIDALGNLDYNDKVLSEFDIVLAAIHSGFEQSARQLTQRLISACKNKHVDIIAHPTGVHIGKREPYAIDLKEVCKAAVDTNTILEINSFPIRLDLNSNNVYFARSQGVKFAVNTDAHALGHLDFIKFGVAIARRGWLEPKHVLNTLPLEKLLKSLRKN